MNIVIHGAINSSNFGDVLFARMFYDACRKASGINVDFVQIPKFGVGEFVRNETGYSRRLGRFAYLKSDVLVLMSGGYLGLDKTKKYDVLHLYARFIMPARLFQLLRKPVYIIGVGGGPIDSKWLRDRIIRLVDKSKRVIVRDEETKKYFLDYGSKANIEVTADTALSYDLTTIQQLDDTELISKFHGKKMLFFHSELPSDKVMAEKIVPSLNIFLESHPEYGVVFGYDYETKETLENTLCWQKIECETKHIFHYHSVDQMLALLSTVDCVMTPKLHIGIMGSLFGKSVLSFPVHREKTQRFYRQIGYPERCIHISVIDKNTVLNQLNLYHDKKIIIPEEIIERSKANLMFVKDLVDR